MDKTSTSVADRNERSSVIKNAKKIVRFLEEKKESISPLLIVAHDYPDPDAMASAYGLQYLAEQVFGITSRIVHGGIVGRMENRAMVSQLKIPMHRLRNSELKRCSNIALVDTQPAFENNSFPRNRKATLIIDQHASETKPLADLAIVDPSCGATSVIITQCLMLKELEIPVRLATALAYGILSDTMNLYRANDKVVVDAYLHVLSRANLKLLARIQNPVRSKKFFTTLGKGIHEAKAKRGVIISHLTDVESPDLVAQVADFLLTYKGVSWAFCTGQYKGKLHVSLRTTKQDAKAGVILRDIFPKRAQAGGHGTIAGGSIKLEKGAGDQEFRETRNILTEKFLKRIKIKGGTDFTRPFVNKTANTSQELPQAPKD